MKTYLEDTFPPPWSFLLIIRTGHIVSPTCVGLAPDTNRTFQHIAGFYNGLAAEDEVKIWGVTPSPPPSRCSG